ncbi:hypothetical protein NIES2107_62650 [Nostoc carneum NIES-2107]|nr:hypothetical protein NIES2107_62650 [Nostoc carneum NIES-2107]
MKVTAYTLTQSSKKSSIAITGIPYNRLFWQNISNTADYAAAKLVQYASVVIQ